MILWIFFNFLKHTNVAYCSIRISRYICVNDYVFREGQKSSLKRLLYSVGCIIVSRFILSHTKLIHLGASTILEKKSWFASLHYPAYSKYSTIFFPPNLISCPFYLAQYIFPAYIQLLVLNFNLSMNLSLNLSKNYLKFHPGQYQHLILWAHLWCSCVPPSSCMQQYATLQYIHAHKTLVHIASMYRFCVRV